MARLSFVLAGLLFAAGLVVGGMTQPGKVVGFLDFAGDWDPSLLFVMVGAIGVHAVAYPLIMRRPSPILAPKFLVPTRRDIDMPLVVGSLVFGVGWGLGGYCPGPAITSVGAASGHAALFVLAMLGGHLAFAAYAHARATSAERAAKRAGADATS